ncbi:hypothetical protein K8M07_04815 [Schnuerera sp. xch1]|uniref:hypothetical protein n=1 Tax=Schnuerera sp. xch1 TaxID=2874283 RepID=UPI001CBD67D8|nr:hypothetical protein [Schnuerera sp. xch1]MBZ2174564.1 hypothetical protein [Schnuerera sp. xch1]
MLNSMVSDLGRGKESNIVFIFLILLLFGGGFDKGFCGIFDDDILLIFLILFLCGGF